MVNNKNKLVIFTGPSGVGKATLEKKLFAIPDLKLHLACSATTRRPRKGEIDGKHYYFISSADFDKKIEDDEFVEWNAHFSSKYGTLKSEIKRIQSEGDKPLLEIETFGARNVINKVGAENVISIFIAPPSVMELKNRIIARGTETEQQIMERMAKVDEELSQKRHFNHVVVNDDVDRAVSEIAKIIREES